MTKLPAVIAMTLVSLCLSACKPKAHDPAATATSPAPAPASTAAAAASTETHPKAAAAGDQGFISQEGFDASKIPMSSSVLPPFPYLNYPDGLDESQFRTEGTSFDEAYVIVGKKLRKVEGRVESHEFQLRQVNMSEVGARRNYENLIKAMGGVKVSDGGLEAVVPMENDAYSDLQSKLRLVQIGAKYDTYVVRTPTQLIWIALMSTDSYLKTLVIAEEPLKQTVGFVTADTMKTTLASAGHVALYINFDTDKAGIRPDGRPAVDEIAKLMDQDPSLKLTIEGHTDNVGDAKHNKALSQQRAEAVMGSLLAAGIAKERMTAVGLGDTKPVADNKDEAGRAKNRRVELVKQA